jgi:hypothetical protein
MLSLGYIALTAIITANGRSSRLDSSPRQNEDAVLLGAKPLRVLREYHKTTGEHQQTDDLEQHQ